MDRIIPSLDTLAIRWYSGWDWGAPHTSRESNFAVAGFKAGYNAALSTRPQPLDVERIRAEAFEEAARWHDQRYRDTPDAFEMEFHDVSRKAIRSLSSFQSGLMAPVSGADPSEGAEQ